MSVTERFIKYLHAQGISQNHIARLLGVKPQTINNQILRSGVSADVLCRLLDATPSLSAEWLMRGEGPMMRGAPGPPPPEPLGGADDEVVRLRAENAVLREQLARTQEMLMGAIGGRKE